MSQVVKIERELEFMGDAANVANVSGNMLEKRKHFSDNFTGDTLSTDKWLVTVDGTSDSIAMNAQSGGAVRITTGTGDNSTCFMSSAIIWKGAKDAEMEARVTITDVSGVALFVGFSDATSETDGLMAINYKDDALTTTADNAVGFVIDADHATSSIMCVGVRGNTDETSVDTGIDWADGEIKTLRVKLDGSVAMFYVDGVGKGSLDLAVTSTTLLCATFQAAVRAADSADTIDIHRVDVWQDAD